MSKLKPCPFCGADPYIIEERILGPGGRQKSVCIRCKICASGTAAYGTKEIATHKWNMRTNK